MRHVAATLLIWAFLAIPSSANAANSWGTDFSDFWWTPGESGWAATLSHQGEVVFMALYVYGPDSTPRWYTAAMTYQVGSSPLVFSGALYETRGPYLGALPFNQSNVLARQVGVATANMPFVNQGSLSYSVDGVFVQKTIQRFTFRNNSLSGSYAGGAVAQQSSCGQTGFYPRDFIITQSGTSVTVNTGYCTYLGTYAQNGRMGSLTGTFSCTNSARGNFQMYELEVGQSGLLARYDAQGTFPSSCTESGRIGGIRR